MRLLGYNFKEQLKKNQIITVIPDTSIDVNNIYAILSYKRDVPIFISQNKKEDRYFCEINKTYFGKIVQLEKIK